jgi:hypothetical protein
MMDFQTVWPYIVAFVSTIVLPLLVTGDNPVGAYRLINYIKEKLGIEDGAALALTIFVNLLLSIVILVADGALDALVLGEQAFTYEAFTGILIMVFTTSQYWYGKLTPPKPAA